RQSDRLQLSLARTGAWPRNRRSAPRRALLGPRSAGRQNAAQIRPRLNFCQETVFEMFHADGSEARAGALLAAERQDRDVRAVALQLLPCRTAGQFAGATAQAC